MSPDEMLLDPFQAKMTDAENEARRERPHIAPAPAPQSGLHAAPEPAAQVQARPSSRPLPLPPRRRPRACRRCARSSSIARRSRCCRRRSARPLRASSAAGPERLRLEDVSIDYGPKRGRQVGLAVDPPGRGAGADRSLRLRQDDAAADAQPPHRADAQRLARRPHHARRRGHPRLADTTLRSRVAMVFQQPNPFPMSIFDNVAFALREQSRKRPRRRELEPLVVDALQRAGLYDEVARRPRPARRCASPAASSSGCASPARSRRGPRCC